MGAAVGRSLVLLAICASSAACEGKAGADSDGTASWPSCAAACQLEGRCTVRDGGCAAASDADCGQSEACRFLGKCAPDRRGACVFGAATDADCRKGRAGIDPCAQWGYCRAVDGRCVAGSDEDCWQSRHCLQYGKCAARDGTCRHTAATDADCWTAVGTEEAETCVEWGFCTARDGVCVAASDADCGQSDQCHDIGKCVADGLGSCTVGSEADCRRSFLCGGGGDCSAEEGWCVRRADDGSPRSPPCQAGLEELWCFPADKDYDCWESHTCTDWGRCSLRDGWCVAASDADCRLSYRCKIDGACKARDGWCVE